jgi:F-box and WD-40 domain protein CDC4
MKLEWVDVEGKGGVISRGKWPKRPLIVTGSWDHSLRVWTLPKPGEAEYRCLGADDSEVDPANCVCHTFSSLNLCALLMLYYYSGEGC